MLEAASLVLTARNQKSDFDSLEASSSSRTGATLVICPVVVVIQWVGEIERYTARGSVWFTLSCNMVLFSSLDLSRSFTLSSISLALSLLSLALSLALSPLTRSVPLVYSKLGFGDVRR